MNLKDLFQKKDTKSIDQNKGNYKDTVTLKSNDISFDSIEYIWVEGYKATDNDMSCTCWYNRYPYSYENKQQYLLGEIVSFAGIPVTGTQGFHFCRTLEDTMYYRPFNFSNRYFKVKALVDKDEWEDKNKDKFASKAIILVEEVHIDFDTVSYYNEEYQSKMFNVNYDGDELPIDKNLFDDIYNGVLVSLNDIWESRFFETMTNMGYSELFQRLLFDRANRYTKQKKILKLANALHEENVSGDVAVYLLMKELDK